MKLSELKGEHAVEVIADIIAPIVNIVQDQKELQLFRGTKEDGETDYDMAVRNFKEKIPKLLKNHKKDVLDILCAINGSNPDDLSVVDIIKGAIELTNDQDFISLFLSAVNTAEQTPPTVSSDNAKHSKPE